MKNFLKILMCVFALTLGGCVEDETANTSASQSEISNNQVYFFYQTTCPHCHHAASYIAQKYPNLKMVNLDVRQPANFNLFLKCAQKFRLSQDSLGTPLICMGDHYIMGWSDADAAKFDMYVQRFK